MNSVSTPQFYEFLVGTLIDLVATHTTYHKHASDIRESSNSTDLDTELEIAVYSQLLRSEEGEEVQEGYLHSP